MINNNTKNEIKESHSYNAVDLDQALTIAGLGWYNLKYCAVLAFFLVSAIVEQIGYSYILPAAKCDLQMNETQRGLIGSIPFIGMVITSHPWGYLVDTRGRKKIIIISSLLAGIFGILAGFMPEVNSFTFFKVLSALCIACPSAAPYSYIGEILPPMYRDTILSITNAMQILGTTIIPLLAWAILSLDFRLDFGLYYFRPWRLLTIIYSSFLVISAILISFGPESPKYLISQNEHDKSLKVLQTIYSKNKKKSLGDYPVKTLLIQRHSTDKTSLFESLIQQTIPLFKPPYLQWLILNGTLFFGIYTSANGLAIWLPELFNQVFSASYEGTACEMTRQPVNLTMLENIKCNDSIEIMTFLTNIISSFTCSLIVLAISGSIKIIGKKALVATTLLFIGVCNLVINLVTDKVVFTILVSTMPMLTLCVGPLNAYAVEIFPTHLRGMAISLTMMVGRCGSIFGGNVTGFLVNNFCEVTFYVYSGTLISCSLLSLLLPSSMTQGEVKKWMTHL